MGAPNHIKRLCNEAGQACPDNQLLILRCKTEWIHKHGLDLCQWRHCCHQNPMCQVTVGSLVSTSVVIRLVNCASMSFAWAEVGKLKSTVGKVTTLNFFVGEEITGHAASVDFNFNQVLARSIYGNCWTGGATYVTRKFVQPIGM